MGKLSAEHLAAIKAANRLTYKELAGVMGVSIPTAQNYVIGRTPVPDEHADRLFAIVGERGIEYVAKGKDLKPRTIPFFDVDVLATPIEVFNDQTTRPAYTIDMPGFQDCDFAIKVYGHSMYPTIESGMIVLCKKVVDMEIIAYGEIYLVVTADLRMVKRLLKSDKAGYVLATSDNHNGHASPDGKTYPPIEIPLVKILHLYLVKGSFKRHLI